MPFTLRTTVLPPLNQLVEIEQVVIIDNTGPVIPLGVSPGAACLVGEFLSGPFTPTEVFSDGELKAIFVGNPLWMDRISQSVANSTGVQDGTAVGFDGNGWVELKGKTLRRLIVQRVDCDMTTTLGGTSKALVKFDVTIAAADQDPDVPTITGRDITIPAGTRFSDDTTAALSTVIVSLSQNITIPKGTTITGGVVTVNQTITNGNGTLGATAFFTKGLTAAIALIDICLDPAIPGVASTIAAASISTINSAGAASAVFSALTGSDPTPSTLGNRIYTRYAEAIDKTLPNVDATRDITYIWSARSYASTVAADAQPKSVRAKLWANAKDSSASGRGRVCGVNIGPAADGTAGAATTTKTAVKAMAAAEFPGIDADRAFINFPYVKIFSTEVNRNILISPSGFKASLCSVLPSEFQTSVENSAIQAIVELEDAFNGTLSRADYVAFKAKGVSAIQKDRSVGWWFYSGVTAANATAFPTRVADNRRRFADEVQDTLSELSGPYLKKPGTTERVDALVGEIQAYLTSLLSAQNPAAQRIEGFVVDATSLNTAQLTALGIRQILVCVRMLGDLNQIVYTTQIGPTVDLSQVTTQLA